MVLSNAYTARSWRNIFESWDAKNAYESIDQIQKELESYLKRYNQQRPHQDGRASYKALVDGIVKPERKNPKKAQKSGIIKCPAKSGCVR